MKRISFLFVFFLVFSLLGCGTSGSSGGIEVIFKSSDFQRRVLQANSRATIALTNLTGMIDSVVFPIDNETQCGFVVYQANDQTGLIGASGRTYEAFDLSTPPTWSYNLGDLQCSGGSSSRLQILAPYLDIVFTVDSVDKTVRVALGDYDKYEMGDVLIKVSDEFNWVNTSGTTLTPYSSTRPTTPYQLASVASATIPDGKILTNMNISVVDNTETASTVSLSEATTQITIDVNLGTPGISITDVSTDAKIASTFTMDAFTNIATSSLTATVTAQ